MAHPMGELNEWVLRLDFDRRLDLPPFFVPVAMLVLARFLGRADSAVAHP